VTDRRTDGQTDRQTDVKPIAITCFSIADARKNCIKEYAERHDLTSECISKGRCGDFAV